MMVRKKTESEPENVTLERSQSSVEIKRDAKGANVFTVKAYADTVEEAAQKALAVFNGLIKKL